MDYPVAGFPKLVVDGLSIDGQAVRGGLADHPQQGIFRKSAFCFGIATADVGVNACEPDLLAVLRVAIIRLAEAIGHENLSIVPGMQTKHPAALVERHRLAKHSHTRITPGIRELLETERIKPIRSGHDDARHRIPHAKKLHGRPTNGNDPRKLRGTVTLRPRTGFYHCVAGRLCGAIELAELGRLLISGKGRPSEILLLRR